MPGTMNSRFVIRITNLGLHAEKKRYDSFGIFALAKHSPKHERWHVLCAEPLFDGWINTLLVYFLWPMYSSILTFVTRGNHSRAFSKPTGCV